jgi:hypothetical protein
MIPVAIVLLRDVMHFINLTQPNPILPVLGVRLIHLLFKSLFVLGFVLPNKDLCHLAVSPKGINCYLLG